MAKFLIAAGVLLLCAGCANTGDHGREAARYQRVEYFETVFLPASEACRKAGGFMIFEDPNDSAGARRCRTPICGSRWRGVAAESERPQRAPRCWLIIAR